MTEILDYNEKEIIELLKYYSADIRKIGRDSSSVYDFRNDLSELNAKIARMQKLIDAYDKIEKKGLIYNGVESLGETW